MTDKLIEWMCRWDPVDRRRWAMRVLAWSVILGVINLALWGAGLVSNTIMLAVTTALSWLALTLTMVDVVVTSDVRVQGDDGDETPE